jgi:cell division protein FtsL
VRLPFFLALLVVASALGVINAQHSSRKLYSALDKTKAQSLQLDAELERLVVDQRALANPQRIEQVARRLGMQPVTAARTLVVQLDGAR